MHQLKEDDGSREQALEELCQRYWFPIYAFLRRRGHGQHDAEDLTQSLFLKLVSKEVLASVSQEQGKLRSFLLRVVQNLEADNWRQAKAARRGGGAPVVSLDWTNAEGQYLQLKDDKLAPDELFDRTWFDGIMRDAKEELRASLERRGRGEAYHVLEGFLVEGQADGARLNAAAAKLGIAESSIRVTVHRLRAKYREILREHIQQTITDEESLMEEITYLGRLFGTTL